MNLYKRALNAFLQDIDIQFPLFSSYCNSTGIGIDSVRKESRLGLSITFETKPPFWNEFPKIFLFEDQEFNIYAKVIGKITLL